MPSITSLPIIIVDEEPRGVHGVSDALRQLGYPRVIAIADAERVASTLSSQAVGAVLLEPALTRLDARSLLDEIVARFPGIPVVVLTAINDISTAVEYLRAGAVDYLVKPVAQGKLASALRRARQIHERLAPFETSPAVNAATDEPTLAGMVTKDPAMLTLFRRIDAIAASPWPVLITGESGSGKEMVAAALHQRSRRPGELVTVNVAGLDDTLFADSLFGHTRGAFTGAERARSGLIDAAVDGTLFLDEIGDLHAASQIKLLRLLQDGSYYPLGDDRPHRNRARVVAATNADITAGVASGRFRRDLYYRLRTHHLEVPPLRARMDDVPLLMRHFVAEAARTLGKPCPRIPPDAYALMRGYSFPGNIRELEAMICDAVALSDEPVLHLDCLRQRVHEASADPSADPARGYADGDGSADTDEELPTLRQAEEALIGRALRRARGNQSLAASWLGLSRQALNKRLSRRRVKVR